MTLPRGFGRGWDEPKEPVICKLGKICNDWNPCTIHNYKGGFILLLGIIITIIVIITSAYFYELSLIPIHNMIDNLNCKDLAIYVADTSTQYSYAEHRYEWLCVNEQVKEFQG